MEIITDHYYKIKKVPDVNIYLGQGAPLDGVILCQYTLDFDSVYQAIDGNIDGEIGNMNITPIPQINKAYLNLIQEVLIDVTEDYVKKTENKDKTTTKTNGDENGSSK